MKVFKIFILFVLIISISSCGDEKKKVANDKDNETNDEEALFRMKILLMRFAVIKILKQEKSVTEISQTVLKLTAFFIQQARRNVLKMFRI
jgi:hypothetical protein